MKTIGLAALGLLGLITAISPAAAQQWPTKPIRILSPAGAGGGADVLGRIVGEHFQKQAGHGWVMDNRPGANGTIAGEVARQAPPDGYTFYITTVGQQAINPHTMLNMPYNPIEDFDSVALMVQQPNVLFVRADDDRFKSIKDIVDFAKKNPGKLNYGVSNIHTSTNMTIAQLRKDQGLDMTLVTYKSSADTALSVLRSETDFSVENIQVVMGQVGKVRPLAVSSKTRSPRLPDVPSFSELGMNIDIASWSGLLAPKGTPKPVIDRMAALIKDALSDAEVLKKLDQLGATPVYMEPSQFKAFQLDEVKKWGPIVEAAGITKQ